MKKQVISSSALLKLYSALINVLLRFRRPSNTLNTEVILEHNRAENRG